MTVNDLAIILTKKIEGDLVYAFFSDAQCVSVCNSDSMPLPDVNLNHKQPSFYNIRETILKSLNEYLDVLILKQKDSPMMLAQMSDSMRMDYTRDQERKIACDIVERIINSEDHFDISTYDDKDYYRSKTRFIAVLKSGLIARDCNKVGK